MNIYFKMNLKFCFRINFFLYQIDIAKGKKSLLNGCWETPRTLRGLRGLKKKKHIMGNHDMSKMG